MQYRVDLFAIFIFLGIIQAIFLCFFFFSNENRKVQSNVFHGLMLLSMALCNLEIVLMYTGYIQDCLWLVDFSEPLAFVIGPAFYLMVLSLIHGEIRKRNYGHFAFPIIYLILVIPFFLQPEAVKYNAWIDSYHIDLPFRDFDYDRNNPRIFWITDNHTDLTLLSLVLYLGLGFYEVIRAFRIRKESFGNPSNSVLKKLRAGAMQVFFATSLLSIIKVFYEHDTGDHFFSVYLSVVIYLTSFRVISQSGFFKPASLAEGSRSKNAGANSQLHEGLLMRLKEVMEKEKPFLQPGFSLPDFSEKLNTSVHTLSQVINEGLGKSFFEMVAEYRVAEAKKLLVEKRNIKVEEIAEQVGYNSKSSFNTAFKRITGKTPSEFRQLDHATN